MPREGVMAALIDARRRGAAEGTRDAVEATRSPRVRATTLPADRALDEARQTYRSAAFARALTEMFADRDLTTGED